jgi:hypothetical protein
VRDGVGDRDVVLDALVQHVEITSDRAGAAERVARAVPGLTPADVLAAPYALIGTVDDIIEELDRHRERWGFTSYVIRADAIDIVAPLIEQLRDERTAIPRTTHAVTSSPHPTDSATGSTGRTSSTEPSTRGL